MKKTSGTLSIAFVVLSMALMACTSTATPSSTTVSTPAPPADTPQPTATVSSTPTGPLLPEYYREQTRHTFAESLVKPVKLVLFTQASECVSCQLTRQLLEEIAALSNQISVEVYDFAMDKTQVTLYNVDKVPAIAIVSDLDYGIRFYGIPSGYEVQSLIEDILDVSRGESGLSPETILALDTLKQPLHIQVFFAPRCPYCPRMVRLTHKLALQSEYIRADAIELLEFPQLGEAYNVEGVPRTVINETVQIEGAVPEADLLEKLMATVEEESKLNATDTTAL